MLILQFSGLSQSLPKNVHLLTFEPWKSDSILVRFEHILEKDEDKKYSQNATFSLIDVFDFFNVADVRETTLAGNQWLNEAERFKFRADSENFEQIPSSTGQANFTNLGDSVSTPLASDGYKITLQPMEIRTFIIRLE